MDNIKNWKADEAHKVVQAPGKSRWYKSYRIQITEITHEYSNLR
jgi:heme-degrading monooxygenase HmoA